MEKSKTALIAWIVALATSVPLFGVIIYLGFSSTRLENLAVAGVLGALILIPCCIWQIVVNARRVKNADNEEFLYEEQVKKLISKYVSVDDYCYNKVGYVDFVKEKIKFSAKGKYGIVKDFNDIPGYHLGFYIEGIKLVGKPKNYDDVIGYESLLFNIELGYFDGTLLSDPENDNGIIFNKIDKLQGKTIKINSNSGYIACVTTAETDEISLGEITFVNWNAKSKVIKFKFLVPNGLCDVVAGTVELEEDKYEDKNEDEQN